MKNKSLFKEAAPVSILLQYGTFSKEADRFKFQPYDKELKLIYSYRFEHLCIYATTQLHKYGILESYRNIEQFKESDFVKLSSRSGYIKYCINKHCFDSILEPIFKGDETVKIAKKLGFKQNPEFNGLFFEIRIQNHRLNEYINDFNKYYIEIYNKELQSIYDKL